MSRLQRVGDAFGDPWEVSTVRREDFEFIRDKSGEYVEVLQNNNEPSSRTMRAHQIPGAFLQTVLHFYNIIMLKKIKEKVKSDTVGP